MWTVRNIVAVIWIEWRHGFLHSKALCGPVAKSTYTEQNYYNTATQHKNSKSSNS